MRNRAALAAAAKNEREAPSGAFLVSKICYN